MFPTARTVSFKSYYFKYGDTLYQEYKIIYLRVVVEDE